MRPSLPIHLDRAMRALAARGVRPRRAVVAEALAATFGRGSSNELVDAAARGELDPPAATLSGDAGNVGDLAVLVDPVAGLPFAVHRSRLARESGGREADHMVSPYGNLLDVSAARAGLVRTATVDVASDASLGTDDRVGWGPPREDGPVRRAPSLEAFVRDARAGGFTLVKVWRTPREVMVGYGEGDPRFGTLHAARVAWFGTLAEADALVSGTFAKGSLARPGRAHPLGVTVLRDRQGADVFLLPHDASPTPMRPDVEGILDVAASTGALRFTLSVAGGLDSLVAEYPTPCAVRHCMRMTWQGDADDASEAIRRMRAGDLGSGRHHARVEAAGEGRVTVAMPMLDAMRATPEPRRRTWGYPVPASVRRASAGGGSHGART